MSMGRLVYAVIASLDGYVADAEGRFDWAAPDAEVHDFVNDRSDSVGTYLYGRRTYELMSAWEHDPDLVEGSPQTARFAQIWQRARKIVYSTTGAEITTRDTELRTRFDAEEVAGLKQDTDTDLDVFGPTLAAHALGAGLVDEVQVTVVPHLVGAGLAWFPGGVTALRRCEVHQFAGGAIWLRYEVV